MKYEMFPSWEKAMSAIEKNPLSYWYSQIAKGSEVLVYQNVRTKQIMLTDTAIELSGWEAVEF